MDELTPTPSRRGRPRKQAAAPQDGPPEAAAATGEVLDAPPSPDAPHALIPHEDAHARILAAVNVSPTAILSWIALVTQTEEPELVWQHRDGLSGLETLAWFGQCAADARLVALCTPADIKAEAGARDISPKTIYSNAQIWNELVAPVGAQRYMDGVLPVLPNKSYHFLALKMPGMTPRAALQDFLLRKQHDSTFTPAAAWRAQRGAAAQTRAIEAAEHEAATVQGVGRFNVLYLDPPWERGLRPQRMLATGHREEGLTAEQLATWPVQACSEGDAALFLWCPPSHLAEGLALLTHWGYTYVSSSVWVQPTPPGEPSPRGLFVEEHHEYLLQGQRGALPPPYPEERPDGVVHLAPSLDGYAPRQAHDWIERMYPRLSKISMATYHARRGDPEQWTHYCVTDQSTTPAAVPAGVGAEE